MNVLVIGQGGREHALVRALRLSPSVQNVHALPGSDGIAQDATCHRVDWKDSTALLRVVRDEKINLVVIGPDNALADGVSDVLREAGVSVFGPSCEAAQLEGSKVYSKHFMNDAGVPTARAIVVKSVAEVLQHIADFAPPYVLKADGLALGKGVFICKTESELLEATRFMFEERALGDAGASALLEEFQPGFEISYHVLTNGEDFEPLVLAQDHKRIFDNDEGPNTGGMGTVAPVTIDAELRARIDNEIVRPTIKELKRRGLLYRGVIFIGLMITKDGPNALEYNARFGDPETQVILPLMDGDWGDVFWQVANGKLPRLKWKNAAACSVVLAAENYPDAPVRGAVINGLDRMSNDDHVYALHAGTRKDATQGWVTNGGRVLNAVGIGKDLNSAIQVSYRLAENLNWRGRQMRRDIGAKVNGHKSPSGKN